MNFFRRWKKIFSSEVFFLKEEYKSQECIVLQTLTKADSKQRVGFFYVRKGIKSFFLKKNHFRHRGFSGGPRYVVEIT